MEKLSGSISSLNTTINHIQSNISFFRIHPYHNLER
jgi:hypothetical protein